MGRSVRKTLDGPCRTPPFSSAVRRRKGGVHEEAYNLHGGVRGKYYQRYKEGTNVVLLEPDLARVFQDSATVNQALRQFLSEHGGPPRANEAG